MTVHKLSNGLPPKRVDHDDRWWRRATPTPVGRLGSRDGAGCGAYRLTVPAGWRVTAFTSSCTSSLLHSSLPALAPRTAPEGWEAGREGGREGGRDGSAWKTTDGCSQTLSCGGSCSLLLLLPPQRSCLQERGTTESASLAAVLPTSPSTREAASVTARSASCSFRACNLCH